MDQYAFCSLVTPGGAKAFELVAKFCYGVRFELTPLNVVALRCASEYLQMTNEYGEGNLVEQTESFLNDVFGNWTDTIKALETCEEVLSYAEELHIVSRCINSLAMKACSDSKLLNWPVMENCSDSVIAVEAGGMRPENISGALVFYAKKYVPLMNRQSSFKDVTHAKSSSTPSEADQGRF
ncbi:hypothetical protein HAX54_048606 [Datura stramonium]|uniref:Uncharacterized protein n=1 Tax=Datura stramonium TaxID=4076 RepID=A0ABS8SVS9_DATST|nr:hypothetical protein [Datura stramonium]